MLTKQTGLNNQFVIPRKNFWSYVQKIKNKHDGGGVDAVFFCLRVCYSQPSGGTDFVSWYQRQKPWEA